MVSLPNRRRLFLAAGSTLIGGSFGAGASASGAAPIGGLFPRTSEQVFYVDEHNTQSWRGDDAGAWINSAYEALPSTGGKIMVAAGVYNFSTPIVFGTARKPVVLAGSASVLKFTSTFGPAITIDNGSGPDGEQGPRTVLADITISGISPFGSNTGLLLGGTNGASGFLLQTCTIQDFATGILFGNNTYGICLLNSIVQKSGQLLYVPGGLINSGEEISAVNCQFTTAGTFVNAVQFDGTGEFTATNCSFDDAQFSNSSQAMLVACHFEIGVSNNPSAPFVNNTGGLVLLGCEMFQDNSSPVMTTAILCNAPLQSRTVIIGLDVTANGTVQNLITLANAGDLTFLGPRTLNPFGNLLNYVGTGAYLFDFGGGAIKSNQAFQFGAAVLFSPAPKVVDGALALGAATASTASAGSAALPANPIGFLEANLGNTAIRIPYYGS